MIRNISRKKSTTFAIDESSLLKENKLNKKDLHVFIDEFGFNSSKLNLKNLNSSENSLYQY